MENAFEIAAWIYHIRVLVLWFLAFSDFNTIHAVTSCLRSFFYLVYFLCNLKWHKTCYIDNPKNVISRFLSFHQQTASSQKTTEFLRQEVDPLIHARRSLGRPDRGTTAATPTTHLRGGAKSHLLPLQSPTTHPTPTATTTISICCF